MSQRTKLVLEEMPKDDSSLFEEAANDITKLFERYPELHQAFMLDVRDRAIQRGDVWPTS